MSQEEEDRGPALQVQGSRFRAVRVLTFLKLYRSLCDLNLSPNLWHTRARATYPRDPETAKTPLFRTPCRPYSLEPVA